MDFDGVPDAKRPKFEDAIEDDNLLPGPPGIGLQRESSISSTGGDKNRDNDSFPQQLMKMLNDPANSHIVAWTAAGDAFVVHSKDLFVAEVMPVYFGKRSKFTSFTRKLNRWGFARNNQGDKKGAYSHPLFHRDDPASHEKMSCGSQPGQGMIRGRGGGGGKAKRRNSGPMALSKANARAEAGLATAAGEATAAGAAASAALDVGVGLITPQIAHGQLTSQMMFGSQGLPDSAGGFNGLSPFGAFGLTPMAMTPGTLSIAGLTPGGVTGLTPGTLTPGILSGLSPMMQINAVAAGQSLGEGLGGEATGGAFGLPPPPPLAGATADLSNGPTNIDNTEQGAFGNTSASGVSQSQLEHHDTTGEGSQQEPSQLQPQQMGNLGPRNNPFFNMGMQFPGGMAGNFANAQQFLQMQQQRVRQQLQTQQIQLLQIQHQRAALANSSNAGSLDGSTTAAPPSREGADGSDGKGDGEGEGDLDDLNTGGLGGTGFSPAPQGDDNIPANTGPVSGNDSMQLIQQMQARLNQQQQLLNGSYLQLQAVASRPTGLGGALLPAGAEPDPLPAGMNPHSQAGSIMNGTSDAPGQFKLQLSAPRRAQLLGQATSPGGALVPATSDPAEEQVDMPNIANDDAKGSMAQPAKVAGATPTPVLDAQ